MILEKKKKKKVSSWFSIIINFHPRDDSHGVNHGKIALEAMRGASSNVIQKLIERYTRNQDLKNLSRGLAESRGMNRFRDDIQNSCNTCYPYLQDL